MLAMKVRFLLLSVLLLPVSPVFAEDGGNAGAIYKCKDAEGRITYTETPCSENAEAMKDLPALNEQPAVQEVDGVGHDPLPAKQKDAVGQARKQQFHCDGRTRCSEMTSCEEAKFFLAHCPGVKMDGGTENGVPCESQWCSDQ